MSTTNSNWGYVPSPIGPIEVPGFDKWRDLSDEDLCKQMNEDDSVDPAGLAVASARKSVCHFYNGKIWVWDTVDNYREWKAQQPGFFDLMLAKMQEGKAQQS